MTTSLISVALGGALGASLRFLLGVALVRDGFPVAVLAANVLGCFVMGLVVVTLGRSGLDHWQPLLMTGLLGGFTTFSAFSLETLTLMERGDLAQAAIYVVLSVGGSLLAVVVGVSIARGVL
ncbi:putative fluoride ion transporter CrcB [Jannaschia pagri]|uniref:Fluoride-specific ion channel FluC n=1 Tax=Jannaschia pagri TaxID=2829797 RepID=A0ABQ4NGQ1_9RHOB|nr:MULTISPECIES: fluoride efflux transporter CrcB [unclassified Jannaschia]GIT90307.1 putative fluoride ion transporter CrcB [Jannaschia sp. AI_61]GIT93587.1 putative fluoride ion transporter CrcB [Jannaschia sp. AI_62]